MKRAVALLCIAVMVLFAIGAAVANVLSARDTSDSEAPQRPISRPSDPDPQARQAPVGLQAFYDQVPVWEACGANECTFVTVPLDYDDPVGDTIRIKLLRAVALDESKRIGALVVNPGGPGAPGTEYAAQAAFAFGRAVMDRFDIVGFDPRGTGASAPVDCLSDEELHGFLAADPTPDTTAEVQASSGWSSRMGAGCVERSGALASHVSTVEAARDMDVIRAVLDERKLTYFGASYGTKLGATYADLFPTRSGRLVLDGAVDSSLSARQLSLGQARGFERALRAYVDNCVDEGRCYLGASRREALRTITGFLDDVDAAPMTVGEREMAVGNAFFGIVLPLYNKSYWMLLDQALKAALDGNGAALLKLSDLYASRDGDSYADNSSEAIWAISCLDDPWFLPMNKIPAQLKAFRKASPTFGDVFAWGLNACEGLEAEPAEPRAPLTAAGADPLLVIGTTRDPATPYEWAEGLAAQLEPAILISRDGDGHTGYHQGNKCVDTVVENYLIDGTVPTGPVTCG